MEFGYIRLPSADFIKSQQEQDEDADLSAHWINARDLIMFTDEEDDIRREGSAVGQTPCMGITYVGRIGTRSDVKELLKSPKGRIVQICAGPMVGKSRFVEQITSELTEESEYLNEDLRITKISLRGQNARSLSVVKMKIAESFHIPSEYLNEGENFQDKLVNLAEKSENAKAHFIVFFDDCDSMIRDNDRTNFLDLITSIVKSSSRTRVIMTSRVEFKFPRLCDAAHVIRLPRLDEEEAMEILRRASPNIEYGVNTQQTIIRKCCHLPLLLIIVARTLEDKHQMLTPEDLCELWGTFPFEGLNPDLSSDDDNLEQIVGKFVSCLDVYLQRMMAVYSYFPGTFTTKAAAYVARFPRECEAKILSLLPLYDRSMVDYNQEKKRFSVFPILRYFVNKNMSHLRNNDAVRLRFAQFYGDLLKKTNSYLYDRPPEAVLSQVYEDWQNVEHLLTEAIHSTDDLFRLNMKVMKNAHDIILVLSPESAVIFYRNCLDAAEKFGSQKEQAFVLGSLGCAVGYAQGAGLKPGMRYLKQAKALAGDTDGYERVKLLSHMEWNYYRQGKLHKAKQYQELALSVLPSDDEKPKVIRTQIAVKSHLALIQYFNGNHEGAVSLLLETMRFAQEQCPYHPAIRTMLNSLGLAYSQMGHHDQAIQYFNSSIVERRRYADKVPRDLPIPLSNLGRQISMEKNNHTLALKILNEALAIREKISWNHPDTAIVLWEMGNCFQRWEKYDQALECLNSALTIYQACIPTHFASAEVMACSAKCYELTDKPEEAIKLYRRIVENRNNYQQHAILERVVLLSFAKLLVLSELSDEEDSWSQTVTEMTSYLKEVIAAMSALGAKQRLEKALEINNHYLTDRFSSADVLDCIARCFEELKQPEEALKYYEKIIVDRGRFCQDGSLREVTLHASDKLLALISECGDQQTRERIAEKFSEYLKSVIKSTLLTDDVTEEQNCNTVTCMAQTQNCVTQYATNDLSNRVRHERCIDSQTVQDGDCKIPDVVGSILKLRADLSNMNFSHNKKDKRVTAKTSMKSGTPPANGQYKLENWSPRTRLGRRLGSVTSTLGSVASDFNLQRCVADEMTVSFSRGRPTENDEKTMQTSGTFPSQTKGESVISSSSKKNSVLHSPTKNCRYLGRNNQLERWRFDSSLDDHNNTPDIKGELLCINKYHDEREMELNNNAPFCSLEVSNNGIRNDLDLNQIEAGWTSPTFGVGGLHCWSENQPHGRDDALLDDSTETLTNDSWMSDLFTMIATEIRDEEEKEDEHPD